jgi:tetratricopeptide (TPR) repeat protein
MHAAGVTCSNCHDPHEAGLKRTGNDTCTFCHQNSPESNEFAELSAGLYDSPEHHLHDPGTPGAQCVSCHMPEKTYMGVDGRRDHSFRIPRPDLAESLRVPEPCTACHHDRDAEWAADIVEEHFGPERPAHFAETFARADRLAPDADGALASLVSDPDQPIMVRASALARLGGYARGFTLDAIRLAARDEPLLRYAAPLAAASLAPETRWRLLAPLLDDELRAVRHQTVTALLPTVGRDPTYRERLAPHLAAWQADQTLNLDFPETLTNIAGAQAAMGDLAGAEASFEAALELQANWVPGLLNLADLYRLTGRDPEAGTLITRALALAPDQPEVSYGYALWLSRQGRLDESLNYFNQAAILAPDHSQFTYTLALALNDSGDGERAVEVLEELLARWPDDQQALMAVVTMLRDQQQFARALPYLDRLLQLRPGDGQLIEFRNAIAAAAAAA